MVVFQVVSWDARDIDKKYTINMYGRTAEGYSVALSCWFQPYFFVRTQDPTILRSYKHVAVQAKDLWGFQNSEKKIFYKIYFYTL
jgi:hypothetical protein